MNRKKPLKVDSAVLKFIIFQFCSIKLNRSISALIYQVRLGKLKETIIINVSIYGSIYEPLSFLFLCEGLSAFCV